MPHIKTRLEQCSVGEAVWNRPPACDYYSRGPWLPRYPAPPLGIQNKFLFGGCRLSNLESVIKELVVQDEGEENEKENGLLKQQPSADY